MKENLAQIMGQMAGLVFASAAGAGISQIFHPHPPIFHMAAVPWREGEISLEQISARHGLKNVLWVDARTLGEYQAETISGAIWLGATAFDQQLEEHWSLLQDEKRPLVIFCSQQACQSSEEVRRKLREALPLLEIHTLRGGWKAWQVSTAGQRQTTRSR